MICRLCFRSEAALQTLQFNDGEEIQLELCNLCKTAFEKEDPIEKITGS